MLSHVQPNAPPPFDPRSICNLILDAAERTSRPITNLALQKLLYFTHGFYLLETKRPLVNGFFEAWQYGPVHPTAYRAFKSAGAGVITFRAVEQDPFTDEVTTLPECDDIDAIMRAQRTVASFARMTTSQLVAISHAQNSPWAYVVDKARTETVFGLRIADEIIASRFKYHKMTVNSEPKNNEPREEAPFV